MKRKPVSIACGSRVCRRMRTDRGPFNTPNVGPNIADNTGIPNTAVTGYTTLGGPTNIPQNRTTYAYADSLSVQKGTHALKFGAEFRPFDTNFLLMFLLGGRSPEVHRIHNGSDQRLCARRCIARLSYIYQQ